MSNSKRVSVQTTINGCSVVRVDGTEIERSLFLDLFHAANLSPLRRVGDAERDIEPHEARSLAARLETLSGELTRAARAVENQRIEFHGGPVPSDEMAFEPTEAAAIAVVGPRHLFAGSGPLPAAVEELQRTGHEATATALAMLYRKPRKGFATLHVHKPGAQCNVECCEVPYGTLPRPQRRDRELRATHGSANGAPELPAVGGNNAASWAHSMATRQTLPAYQDITTTTKRGAK